MSTTKNGEDIVNVINQLRKRKARPDEERISQMVERLYGIKPDIVKTELATLVKNSIIEKIDFKGNISYRSVRSSCRRTTIGGTDTDRDLDLSDKLVESTVEVKTVPAKRGRPFGSGKSVRSVSLDNRKTSVSKRLTNNSAAAEDLSVEKDGSEVDSDSSACGSDDKEKDDDDTTEETVDNLIVDRSGTKDGVGAGVTTGGLQMTVESEAIVTDNNSSATDCSSKTVDATAKTADLTTINTTKPEEKVTTCGAKRENISGTGGAGKAASSSPSKKNRATMSGYKRRKIKKNHGPEFESFSLVKRARHDGSTSDQASDPKAEGANVCVFCRQSADKNKNKEQEDFLICKDCTTTVHPSCMDYTEELARRASRSPWQCWQCKTCNVCNDSGDPDAMLFCDSCDKGYHMNCHNPAVPEKPTGKWVCCQCTLELVIESENVDDKQKPETETDLNKNHIVPPVTAGGAVTLNLPTPSASPVQFITSEIEHLSPKLPSPKIKVNGISCSTPGDVVIATIPKLSETLKGEVPDASSWSVTDVTQFFVGLGFVQQAQSFKDQEIDGKALLLMTRSDVLTGMSIKLGPALKIHAHIQRLQSGSQRC